ncbi:hypothetical protein JAAARDRAFT_629892 [Jaapia argillacea MUCL 33604]|uniref:Uncharacterized protein n=1 Tax=Jaapia argillacea MUCL 33604 TaxID=933084 RepID=A0A067PYB7_9AGAM|nr:hypothetical protein JAAARDRAFT_629892 [Jaapia argillacea MUCL 33604]
MFKYQNMMRTSRERSQVFHNIRVGYMLPKKKKVKIQTVSIHPPSLNRKKEIKERKKERSTDSIDTKIKLLKQTSASPKPKVPKSPSSPQRSKNTSQQAPP